MSTINCSHKYNSLKDHFITKISASFLISEFKELPLPVQLITINNALF